MTSVRVRGVFDVFFWDRAALSRRLHARARMVVLGEGPWIQPIH